MGGYDTTPYCSAPLERLPTHTPIFLQIFRSFPTSRTSRTEAPLSCAFPSLRPQCFLRVQTPKSYLVQPLVHPVSIAHKKRLDPPILRLAPHFAPFCALCSFCCAFGPELFRTYSDMTDLPNTINKPPDGCIIMTSLGFIVPHLHSHELRQSPRHFCCAPA